MLNVKFWTTQAPFNKINNILRKTWTKLYWHSHNKWPWASKYSFTATNLRWENDKSDALKRGSALTRPQWAHSQY